MNNKFDRVLFFWIPILTIYLYIFNLVLEINMIKKIFTTMPVWAWLLIYFAVMFSIKKYLKSFERQEKTKIDYTEKNLKANSDIILVFLFSIISFALVMYLLGTSLQSALTLK